MFLVWKCRAEKLEMPFYLFHHEQNIDSVTKALPELETRMLFISMPFLPSTQININQYTSFEKKTILSSTAVVRNEELQFQNSDEADKINRIKVRLHNKFQLAFSVLQ